MVDAAAVRAFEHAGWEQAAAHYEHTFASATQRFIPALLDAVRVASGMHVLDVACGPGFVAAACVERGAVARGLDFSAAMLGVARRLHPGIPLDRADAEALPYPDEAFDAVVSNFGIHHVPRPDVALLEARRVLRAGAGLAFSVWAPPEENIAWKLVLDAVQRFGDTGASAAPAPGGAFRGADDCVRALERCGFSSVGCERVEATWQHPDGRALLTALRSGTARMAALIKAQAESAIPAIIADIDRAAERYRGGGLAVPIVGFVAHGRRVSG